MATSSAEGSWLGCIETFLIFKCLALRILRFIRSPFLHSALGHAHSVSCVGLFVSIILLCGTMATMKGGTSSKDVQSQPRSQTLWFFTLPRHHGLRILPGHCGDRLRVPSYDLGWQTLERRSGLNLRALELKSI